MNYKQLLAYAETLVELKNELKCAICLDVTLNVVELDCNHRFCKTCFQLHKSYDEKNSHQCPLCKKPLARRSPIYKDKYADALSTFVREGCRMIKDAYNCEVEKLCKCLKEYKQLSNKVSKEHIRKLLVKPHDLDIPSTNKSKQKDNGTEKDIAFELLFDQSPPKTFNKGETKRTYYNKKKKHEPDKYEILCFDDDVNKINIINWLNDNKNRFDRLSQTQAVCKSQTEEQIIDLTLPSVSQKNRGPHANVNYLRKKPTRSKSADRDTSNENKERVKRHSYAGVIEEHVVEEEEKIVEEVEKKVIQNLLEDECLDNFEEIIQSSLEEPGASNPKMKGKMISPDTGWNRLKTMNKTMKKGVKKPKKLKIMLENNFSVSKAKMESSVTGPDIIAQDITTVADKRSEVVENVNQSQLNAPSNNDHNIYDLDTLENYIASNMVFIDKNKSSDTSSFNVIEIENESSRKEQTSDNNNDRACSPTEKLILNDFEITDIANEDTGNSRMVNAQIHQADKTVNSIQECKFCEHLKKNSEYFSKISEVPDSVTNPNELISALHDYVNGTISLIDAEKNDLSKLLIDCLSNINLYLKNLKHLNSTKLEKHIAVQTINNLQTKGVQTECTSNNALTQTTVLTCDKNIQTKKIDYVEKFTTCSIKTQTVQEKDEQSATLKLGSCETSRNINENIERPIPIYQKEIKQMNPKRTKEMDMIDTKKCEDDQNIILTGSLDNFNFETQEISKLIKNRSAEVINTKTDQRKMYQNKTEDDQNLLLTGSLDNFNFETQEISKIIEQNKQTTNKTQKTVSVEKTNSSKDSLESSQPKDKKSSSSVLLVSLEPEKEEPKRANRKLTFSETQSKKFKRIRVPNSDSDSDNEENPAKRGPNRFVRNDLSIQFADTERIATQATKNSKENKDQLTESESLMDYDEYLDEVLKKYDSPSCSPSKQSKKSNTQPQLNEKDANLVELLDKCDQLIEQATKTIGKQSDSAEELGSEIIASKRLGTKHSSVKSSTDTSQNNPFSNENFFMDEHNLQELDKQMLEYEQTKLKALGSEYSDVIGETESMSPLPKKKPKISPTKSPTEVVVIEHIDSKSIFNDEIHKSDSQNQLNVTQGNLDKVVKSINKEIVNLDDDLDAELEEIQLSAEKRKRQEEKEAKVVVLYNIKLKSQQRKDEKIKVMSRSQTSDSNEEVFSDDDIVETTPMKDKTQNRSILSQLEAFENNSPNKAHSTASAILVTSENIFEALPPPPGFEDDIDTTKSPLKDQITVIDRNATIVNKLSLTPDDISQLLDQSDKENEQKNQPLWTPKRPLQLQTNLNLTKKSLLHSTPNTQNIMAESLGMSPITKASQQVNFIEVVKISPSTPLVATPNLRKQMIMTSTPKQKSIWNYMKTPKESLSTQQQGSQKSKPCVACTRLSKDQMASLSCMTNKKLITYSSDFTPLVTHMVVSVNEDGCVRDHTVKYVLAVASGLWVVKYQWVQDCINSNSLLPEKPYEVLDVAGNPGPKTSRLTRKTNPLFKGFKFHCAPPFANLTKEDVEEIIKLLGGKIYQSPKDLTPEEGSIRLIVTETAKTQDFDQFETWLELYRVVTVDIEWLIKSVGQYKVLSIRPYVLCSDDFMSELGYPSHLMENVPLSFSEPL